MRTTLVIDDALLRAAKQHAVARGLSLSELVSAALRDALAQAEQQPAPPPFEMITYGRGQTRHEPADFAAVEADEDRAGLDR